MTSHPSVAGAAVLAGLLVAGGAYAARHDVAMGSALQASATARLELEQELPPGHPRRLAAHTLPWHPPHVPRIRLHPRPLVTAPASVAAAPAVTTVTTAPVTRTSPAPPTTRTSPVGGEDDGSGGDD